jgi:hypothetical protein
MSVRSVAPEEVADVGRHGSRGTRSQSHGHAAWGATKAAAYHSGAALHDAGRSFATSTAHHAGRLGGHIWAGLTALGSKVAHHAAGAAHAAKGHISTFTNHVATAHNEVVQALVAKTGNTNAHIHETHFVRHHEMAALINKHIAEVVRSHGLLVAGASANHIVVAADHAAGGASLDHTLAETVKHHSAHRNAPVRQQTTIVTATDSYVKHGGHSHHAGHRAANAQATASAAILTATVAGAEQADAGHV